MNPLIILVAFIGIVSTYIFGNDNPIEEYSEEIIKEETGVDIDFTPSKNIKKVND